MATSHYPETGPGLKSKRRILADSHEWTLPGRRASRHLSPVSVPWIRRLRSPQEPAVPWGATMRRLGRDVGGMPMWMLALVAVVCVVFAAVLVGGSEARGKAPQYTAPTDATTPHIPAPMPLAV